MNSIIVIGTSIIDQVMNLKNDFLEFGCNKVNADFYHGGSMRNVAEICSLLHLEVSFISKFGNDGNALDLISHLEKENVSVYGPTIDLKTPIFTKINGNREFMFATTTPDFSLNENDLIPLAVLNNQSYGITDNHNEKFLDVLLKHGANTKWILSSFIPNITYLNKLEGIILNEYEYRSFLKEQKENEYLSYLFDNGLNWMIITQGSNGCSLIKNRQTFHFPTQEKEGNTLGCGDAFSSGIIYGLVQNWDDERMIAFAQKLATITLNVSSSVNQEIKSLFND